MQDLVIPSAYLGCRDQVRCPKCQILMVCNSSRAGQREGDILYIHGPCCCARSLCDECGYDWFPVNGLNAQTATGIFLAWDNRDYQI
jgi:hypothetical protein